MKRDFNDNDPSDLSKAIAKKTVAKVEVDWPRSEKFLVITFTDGSNLRLEYNYIESWELDE